MAYPFLSTMNARMLPLRQNKCDAMSKAGQKAEKQLTNLLKSHLWPPDSSMTQAGTAILQ